MYSDDNHNLVARLKIELVFIMYDTRLATGIWHCLNTPAFECTFNYRLLNCQVYDGGTIHWVRGLHWIRPARLCAYVVFAYGKGHCVQVGTVWTLFCARASSLRKPNPQFSSVQVRTLNAISKKFNYEHVCALPHDTPNRSYPMFTYSLSYSSAYLRSLALYTWRWKSMLTIIARRWWSARKSKRNGIRSVGCNIYANFDLYLCIVENVSCTIALDGFVE